MHGKRERDAIEKMQLKAPDAYGQSAFQGDAERFEALRRPCVALVHKNGSYLDIGCANGLLLECAVKWAEAAGHRIEPFGLDHSSALVALAKERLRLGDDRLFVGDAHTWAPPRRFDFVRTELVYVPGEAQRAFVERILKEFLETDGRLIVASYGTRGGMPAAEDVGAKLRGWGIHVVATAEGVDSWSGRTLTRVAWARA